MESLAGLLMIIGAMAWMAVGGWAWWHLQVRGQSRIETPLFVGCLIFGPFLAGAVLAEMQWDKTSAARLRKDTPNGQ